MVITAAIFIRVWKNISGAALRQYIYSNNTFIWGHNTIEVFVHSKRLTHSLVWVRILFVLPLDLKPDRIIYFPVILV